MKKSEIILACFFLFSCRTEAGNEQLAGASEKVGESAATVVKSVKSGIEKISKINIQLSEGLTSKGISTGKISLSSKGGRHNLLSVYMIFEKNVNKNIVVKVVNSQGLEVGRSKVLVKAEAGDAKIIDFVFDKRTNIDRDNVISMD